MSGTFELSQLSDRRTATPPSEAPTDEESGNLVGGVERRAGSSLPATGSSLRARVWQRLRGKDRRRVGWLESLRAIVFCSFLNILLPVIPIAWVVHLVNRNNNKQTGGTSDVNVRVANPLLYIALIPLEKLFEWGGEQLSLYCGPDLGDLIVITLNNIVEGTLALVLLLRCELRLLHSTIIGVVLLRLLLLPGSAFLIGGAHIWQQRLSESRVQLNHVLLITGVMTLLAPAAFFSVLNNAGTPQNGVTEVNVISDSVRGQFLQMARGAAVILLLVYICSRIYLYNPPGGNNTLRQLPGALPDEVRRETELEEGPGVNPYACMIFLVICVGLMAVTSEFLVEDIDPIKNYIGEEWFGLFFLPLISSSAGRLVSTVYFIRSSLKAWLGTPRAPSALQETKSIDLSIQFLMFWTPVLVIIGWFTRKPMHLLFDVFEVTILTGACFLVNYVTADARTNYAEGFSMIAFYAVLALVTWYYPGQPQIALMSVCESVASVLVNNSTLSGE
ncbi:hypothetical protein K488DRAFT_90829 [Vararia minispora EC-137]|uniref:Uncharacterized protein n=1 Tax=Vararia minispora EC-137 TaxID=1314806 RepID=A0ACB8Q700_9AGAM|nr:hypothetical protein K488DRAFT_90829 [Vararia minispora EC-137]